MAVNTGRGLQKGRQVGGIGCFTSAADWPVAHGVQVCRWAGSSQGKSSSLVLRWLLIDSRQVRSLGFHFCRHGPTLLSCPLSPLLCILATFQATKVLDTLAWIPKQATLFYASVTCSKQFPSFATWQWLVCLSEPS